MASSKIKFNRKNTIQLTLLLIGIFFIFFTYFGTQKKENLSKDIKVVEESSKKFNESIDEDLNKFEDVEYKGIDANGNRFVIWSNYAEFSTDKPEIINMTDIICNFYFKDGTTLRIISDYGIYNNITNDMEFNENVKMNYLENVLFSQRVNFTNIKNELIVEGNVITEGPDGKLRADRLDFDLNSKKLKISMYNNEKVNIKVNLQWKKTLELLNSKKISLLYK